MIVIKLWTSCQTKVNSEGCWLVTTDAQVYVRVFVNNHHYYLFDRISDTQWFQGKKKISIVLFHQKELKGHNQNMKSDNGPDSDLGFHLFQKNAMTFFWHAK